MDFPWKPWGWVRGVQKAGAMEKRYTPPPDPGVPADRCVLLPPDPYGSGPARQGKAAPTASEEECHVLRERIRLSEQARQRAEAENRRLAGLLAGSGGVALEAGHYADFLSVLVHEFRNPLTPILTSAQLLKRYGMARPELLESAAGSIERQVRQLSQMIADLSDFSRMEQGRLELNLESLDAVALTHHAAETGRQLLAKRRQSLRVELPPPESWSLQADPVRLGRVLEILLAHASRYTPAEGEVRLGLWREGRGVSWTVRAEAMGLAPPRLEHLFEPFIPLDPPLHGGKHEGMGIALALARCYAGLHGGSLGAEVADTGPGGRFVLALPLSP